MEKLIACTVTAMVSDMDKAIDFYTQKLGLKLLQRFGDHYAEIETPNMKIGLHPASDKLVKGNNLSIGFGVLHLNPVIKELEANEVEFRVEDDGWSKLAIFSDPDGNSCFIAEIKG